MSWMGRFANLFRRARLDRELDEELASHLEEAIERGRSAEEARRAFGATLRHREASRDIKLLPWLDAVASDLVFGWRQLNKHRASSAAAILSLALAIGATTAAFRLVDAVMLRPLTVKDPSHLYYLATTYFDDRVGRTDYRDDADYPTFLEYRQALANKADLIVAGGSYQQDVTFQGEDAPERPFREFVSGNFFDQLGIQPALGRLLTPNDDVRPGGHPVAVIGYDYWTRRFARDSGAIGKTFRIGETSYQIVGVAARGFTSTEPGVVTDIYLPAAMNGAALESRGWTWFRILFRPKPGVSLEQIRQPLQALLSRDLEAGVKTWNPNTPKKAIANFLNQSVLLLPAGSGASELQKEYRRPLIILGVLVLLVLLVACANVGNLLSVQAAARAREMALRISIGAGRRRLIQLVLVESLLLAGLAALLGVLFSWWSAPMVVSMLAPPDRPVRLVLGTDWRVLAFGAALTVTVAVFFGIVPALRASAIHPMSALRGGQDLPARRGMMRLLVGLQVAFCVLVLFVAGLFVTTFDRLSNRPLGYSPQRVLAVQVNRPDTQPPAPIWRQVTGELPGVESVAFAGWTLLSGKHRTMQVEISGRAEEAVPPYSLDVSPGFFATMQIGLIDGRDFRDDDRAPGVKGKTAPVHGVGIVNQAFARTYFDGRSPVGQTVALRAGQNVLSPVEIVGLAGDAVYSTVRETIRPTIYFPVGPRNAGTLLVRTAADPRPLTAQLRRDIPRVSGGYTVGNVESQIALVRSQMIREKLVATLSLFFAIVALILAAVGLYGVLTYSALLDRREIGIRMALGARPIDVVRRLTGNALLTVIAGIVVGIAGGLACGRFAEALLFGVKASDSGMIALPAITLLAAAVVAAIPPAIRAVQLDPSRVLRD